MTPMQGLDWIASSRPAVRARWSASICRRRVEVERFQGCRSGIPDFMGFTFLDQQHGPGFEVPFSAIDGGFATSRNHVQPLVGAFVRVVRPAGDSPFRKVISATWPVAVPGPTRNPSEKFRDLLRIASSVPNCSLIACVYLPMTSIAVVLLAHWQGPISAKISAIARRA